MDQKPKLVSLILSKSHTDISSNTLRASSKVEGSVLEGSVKKVHDGVDQKPKLVKPITSVRPDSGYESGLSKKGQKVVEDRKVSLVGIETGDFEEEADLLLVGRTVITGLSTTKGRKLEDNEIVHFAFPNGDVKVKSGYWANSRGGSAACGTIGRLPMEWSKCLIPLVNSKKVKVLGRCVAAPASLSMMQEIMLYISFYIHHSIYSLKMEIVHGSWILHQTLTLQFILC
ncbi:putative HIRAN domain-containing protein [Helianthus debilis subsp. tardiflorus]